MRLPKNILSGTYAKPRIFLCETSKERIGELITTNTSGVFKFNAYSEFSFEVGRTYNNIMTGDSLVNPYYDKIDALRLIEVEGFGYFELQGPELIGDGIKESKSCTAYSLEYTLSQKYLVDFYINTGEIGSVEVTYAENNNQSVIPVTLYNPSNPQLSLLHLVLEKVYGWKIGHVDSSLTTLGRQFEIDRQSVYDFLMNEVCEKFNCYIVFDTINNTINVYAESATAKFIADGLTRSFTISRPFAKIGTVSIDGYKTTQWEYNSTNGVLTLENIPSSGSRIEVVDGALTEWETDVFVSFENLAHEINIDYDADDIKTVLTVTYGEDNDIRETNLGLPYLTDLSYYYTVDWMGQELYDAYTAYLQKCDASQSQYIANAQEMLDVAGNIDFEENRLSLDYSVAQSVSSDTVGTYYVRGGTLPNYYYTEVSLPAEYNANTTYYSIDAANLNENKVANLLTVLKLYYNNDNTWEDKMAELSDDFKFMDGYTFDYLLNGLKTATDMSEKEVVINNFLVEMWRQIGRTPLKTLYHEPYKQVQLADIEAEHSNKNNENYWLYYPIVLLLNSIDVAIKQRDVSIASYQDSYSAIQKENITISNELVLKTFFAKYFNEKYPNDELDAAQHCEQALIRLSSFLREDELHLDDIVETSQDSIADSFKVKQDAMESGRIELQKLCQPHLQFSMSMANIYALHEFEPIVDQFQLGNVIKVALRKDYIKQSRLLQVNINFEDFSDFSCEFGELTNLRSQSDIHADLLSQAISAGKSVATNASYWTKGTEQSGLIQQKIDAGLLDAVTSIKSIDGTQGVEINKYGILMRDIINPKTGEVSPEQGWITNNKFLYTDDGFKSTKSVFGKYTYNDNTYYGILAEALVGSMIVGTQIELGNANGTMKFNEEGLSVTNGSTTFTLNPDSNQLINLSSDAAKDLFYIDENGMLHIAGDGKNMDISSNTTISDIRATEEEIKLMVKNEEARATEEEGKLVSRLAKAETDIIQTQSDITLRATKQEVEDYKDYIANSYYTKEQTNEAILDISADEIAAKVNEVKSYVDNNYSNTNEMNAAIAMSAESITSEVSKNYATIGHVSHYGTCDTVGDIAEKIINCDGFVLYAGASISVKFTHANSANSPRLTVGGKSAFIVSDKNGALAADSKYNWDDNSTVTFVYDGTYWRLSDSTTLKRTQTLSSKIEQTAEDITLEVSRAEGAEEDLRSQIKQTASAITLEVSRAQTAENDLSSRIEINEDAIKSKVNNGDLGTLIEQNYDHVKIAWNKISEYIQFDNSAMNIYTTKNGSKTLLMKHNSGGAWYYNNGTTVGCIGTNSWKNDDSYRGLTFDLEYNASYMCWAAKDSSTADTYEVKLIYHHKNSKFKQGLHFSCNTYANSNLYLADNYRFVEYIDGDVGYNGPMAWVDSSNTSFFKVDGPNKNIEVFGGSTFKVYNNVSLHFFSNLDMNGYSILNQSDARLKTNIQDSQVDALNIINNIEMKEFDWIENGEHEDIGIIAQQLQTIAPDLVYENQSTGKLSIKINKFIPYLVKSIQELTDYITGGISTFSSRRWVDMYTDEEKSAFIASNPCWNETHNKALKELETPKILIPIEQKGEDNNEQQ